MMRAAGFIFGIVMLLFLLPAAGAAAPPDEEGVLFYGGETVSTPSRRPQTLEQSPAPVTVITRDDIRRSGALTLPEVLELAPGVDAVRRSEANVEISVRGFNTYSSNKVLVMLDSRPLFNLADAGVNWNLIPVPIDAIERVEIVRGPGSVLYGENAFFGTINIITRKSGDDSALVGGGGGSGPSWAGRAGASARHYAVYAEYLDLDRFARRGAGIPNQLLDELDAEPVAAAAWVRRAFARWDGDGAGSPSITGGYAQVETAYPTFHTLDRSAFVALDTRFRDHGVDYELGLRVLGQDESLNSPPFPSGPYQTFARTDLELRGVYSPAAADVVVFGMEASHRVIQDDVLLLPESREVRQAAAGAYVENEAALLDRRVFVTTGVRADGYQGERGVVSPRVGVVYILTPEQSLKLGWGQAFRSPSVYELYGEDTLVPPWEFVGDPGLRPESVSSWNLDYFYQDSRRSFSATLFYSEIHDLIIYRLDSQSLLVRRYRLANEDRATSYGGEVEAKAAIGMNVRAWANYSYNEAVYHREGEDIAPPFSPRHKANAGVDFTGWRLRVSLWVRYVGTQTGVNFDAPFHERVEINDYGTVSARVELSLGHNLALSATASDLGGGGHYEAPTYAPVGPYYFVQLRWEPGR